MENFLIGILSSLVAGIILAAVGKWQGWWWRSKSQASIDLATRVLKHLDCEAEDKIRAMVDATKHLGDSLIVFYKNNTPHKTELETKALSLIEELNGAIRPLATELSAANSELDKLKKAVNSYHNCLERRAQIIKHLCHPPNPPAIDPGHVRDQLLSENVLPHDLLKAAKGEAAIFLSGYGINMFSRKKHLRRIIKKQRAFYKEAVAQEYRKILQQTSLHKAKK